MQYPELRDHKAPAAYGRDFKFVAVIPVIPRKVHWVAPFPAQDVYTPIVEQYMAEQRRISAGLKLFCKYRFLAKASRPNLVQILRIHVPGG